MKLLAISSQGIDVPLLIGGSYIAPPAGPTAPHVHMDNISVERRPFALNPPDAIAKVQGKVIDLVLRQRLQNRQPEIRRFCRDRQLGDVALVVGVVLGHEHMFVDKGLPVNTLNVQRAQLGSRRAR